MSTSQVQRIVAIVPCHNEELSVGTVVADLRAAVPGIDVYVYDNDSFDATAEVARAAGAIVRYERMKGKGNAVRRAFADVDADIYVLIDGDDTYAAADLPIMIDRLAAGPYDHVLGVRRQTTDSAYRPGHELGNRAFNWLVGRVFKSSVTDMLSGYRVLSRRFVKSFPALSREFEIETELTVHAMSLRVPQSEVLVGFKDRPQGSESKLRTYHDGFRILSLIIGLVRHERPLMFYGVIGGLLALVGVILGIPIVAEYAQTGLVLRLPTVILALGIVLLAFMSWMIGLILDGVLKSRRELSRLSYLGYAAPKAA
ncbi:MAG: glycosyltransferase [Microbacterium sp.]|uniref:glycosyltransferase n=1 Tax=Microbacterium sp. TaxID=51671 RepID=UPI0039E4CDB6